MDASLIAALLKLAPDLASLVQELNVDLKKCSYEEILLLHLILHDKKTTEILNELHNLAKKISEDTAVLLRRSERG
jgi:hypothetical protein